MSEFSKDPDKAEKVRILKEEIRQLIDAEPDEDHKSVMAMLYMLGEYAEYVKEVNPDLHEKAMEFCMETNRLKTVSFKDLNAQNNVEEEHE